jgi:predicted RNase H-like nuclease
MRYVGVDGCRYGWVGVALSESGSWVVALDRTFKDVVHRWRDARHILVDVPIGLRDGGIERACDLAARAILGKRRSSVFPAPARSAIYAESYEQANRLNREACGRGLSRQSWAIMAKIREVDELLQNDLDARKLVRECHPEVLFWGLAGAPMEHNKKRSAGREERLAVLEKLVPDAAETVAHARRVYRLGLVAADDVIDALAAAVVARRGAFRTIPDEPERDGVGLRMEMVYAT